MDFDDTNEIALELVDVLIKNYPEDIHARSTRGIVMKLKTIYVKYISFNLIWVLSVSLHCPLRGILSYSHSRFWQVILG